MWSGIVKAWTVTAEVFRDVFQWKTGGRTRDENAIRKEASYWHDEYKKAMAKGDIAGANIARAALRELRQQARAKST